MTTNNNKHITTNEVMRIRQSLFSHTTFLSLTFIISVVLNVSSSHSNTNLTIRRFSQEQFLISKYS